MARDEAALWTLASHAIPQNDAPDTSGQIKPLKSLTL